LLHRVYTVKCKPSIVLICTQKLKGYSLSEYNRATGHLLKSKQIIGIVKTLLTVLQYLYINRSFHGSLDLDCILLSEFDLDL
jgi:serine/threonine protein kinase